MFIPFYIKTDASLLRSLIKIDDLIERAKQLGFKALAISDNKMYNAMEFYEKCNNAGIKPIIGLEITISDLPITLYAKNNDGYKELLKLVSLKEIKIENLKNNGIFALIPFSSQKIGEKIETILDTVYYTYETEEEYDAIKEKKCLYASEICFLQPNDIIYMPYLTAIRTGKMESSYPMHYLKTKEEYLLLEKNCCYHEKIFNECNVTIFKRNDLLPVFDCPEGYDDYTYLKKLCLEGIQKKIGRQVPKIYQERLKQELEIIHKMGFCNYFLIVSDYVWFAKKNHILVGPGRGSAAGSLVAYVLDITEIDPIRYNLLFERFLNPMRITMPDIDIDFEFLRREEVINYCIQKYGYKKVAGIITFGTFGSKQALRDVARILQVDPLKIDSFIKLIDPKLTLKENETKKEIQAFLKEEEFAKIYQIALHLEGLKRHTSVHAAGIVISNKELDEVVPLDQEKEMAIVGYNMEYLEKLGLLKMDFLALKTLTTIQNILSDLKQNHIYIDWEQIPLDDENTFSLFSKGDTLGIFQFEKPGMIDFLRKLKPKNFEDIFASLALYRPGPMENIDLYIQRKEGKVPIDYIDSSIEDILKPTYGIIIYQEQIMQIACKMAGYTLGEADILRRAISKKKEDILLQEKERFIAKAVQNYHDEAVAKKVFEYILKFASYGFNRSHSVAYAMLSYKMAYLKAHYHAYFMRSLLSSSIGSSIDTKNYIEECKNHHISILNPDINLSEKSYVVTDKGILYPLNNIKNVGSIIANAILEERKKGDFKDIYDFVKRTDHKLINKRVLESLILAGCFDSFQINRKTLIQSLDMIMNYGDVMEDLGEEYQFKPILEEEKDYTSMEKMEQELELFGFYLSNHPILEIRNRFSTTIPLKEIENYFDKVVDIIVMVESYRIIESKNQKQMAFLFGSDESKKIDCVLFPTIYEQAPIIKKGDMVIIRGKVEKRFDKYQIVVSKIKKINMLQKN